MFRSTSRTAALLAGPAGFVVPIGSLFGGRGDDEGHANPLVLLATAILAPIAGSLSQMALCRSREFEPDWSGTESLGTGESLASALEKLEAPANRALMNVPPSQASHLIASPLTGRHMQFADLIRTHLPTAEPVARLQAR